MEDKNKKVENPSAFPATGEQCNAHDAESGMTLRDYFAAKAMQAMISNSADDRLSCQEYSERAYKQADAMLEQRLKIN